MRTSYAAHVGAALMAAASLVGPAPAAAQDLARDWFGPAEIGFEIGRPFFDGEDGLTALSGFAHLSGVLGSGRTRVLFEIPLARGGIDGSGGSSSLVGSPFIGVARRLGDDAEGAGASGSLGIRIPVPEAFVFGDDDFAVGLGVLGDADRWEAFLTKTATLSGALRVESRTSPTLTLVGQFDADALVYVGDTAGDRVEVFTGWGGLARFEGEGVFGSAGVTGRFLLSEDGDDRVWHQAQARVGLDLGGARPWVSARIPIQGGL
ncbi:MAG: hypothetical protein RLN75_06960, partial [Longimicrobiales bacterium]